jgi:AcrR family transcriptional regulator
MARRTKAEAEATREAILDAAESVFYERGVARASLEEVARTANLTRGAIYWHFKNKVELFNAMVERVRLPLDALIEELEHQGGGDPIAALRGSFRVMLQKLASNDQYRRVYTIVLLRFEQLGEFAESNEYSCQASRQVHHTLCALFERADVRGQLLPNAEPALAAMVVRLFLVGLHSEWLREPDRYDLETWGLKALDAILRGFVRETTA